MGVLLLLPTLQVFSAICVVFAHGAGEVGYMTGPLSVIYDIYMNGTLNTKLQPQVRLFHAHSSYRRCNIQP